MTIMRRRVLPLLLLSVLPEEAAARCDDDPVAVGSLAETEAPASAPAVLPSLLSLAMRSGRNVGSSFFGIPPRAHRGGRLVDGIVLFGHSGVSLMRVLAGVSDGDGRRADLAVVEGIDERVALERKVELERKAPVIERKRSAPIVLC